MHADHIRARCRSRRCRRCGGPRRTRDRQAAGLPLEPATPQEEVTTTQHAGPVLALWDPQTGSSSLSSNVNARGLCIFQSISAQGGLDCFNGAQ